MKTTAPVAAMAAIIAFTPLTYASADEAAQPSYRTLHHVAKVMTPVLDKKTIALKVQQQGYRNLSRFSVEGGAFLLNATNAKGEDVIVYVHPELGIVLGEKTSGA